MGSQERRRQPFSLPRIYLFGTVFTLWTFCGPQLTPILRICVLLPVWDDSESLCSLLRQWAGRGLQNLGPVIRAETLGPQNIRKFILYTRVCVWVALLCPTLCDPMGCSQPGSSIHTVLLHPWNLRILEWVAIPFSRRSSQPRDWTQVSCIAVRVFNF